MTRNRLTSGLNPGQRQQYDALTDDDEQRLYLDTLDTVDLTVTPTPERAAETNPLPADFLPGISDGINPVSKAVADSWEQLLTGYATGKDKQHLRGLVDELLRQQQELLQQQTTAVQEIISPLLTEHRQLTNAVDDLAKSSLNASDVSQVIGRQIDANLRDVPSRLSDSVEGYVRQMVPAVIRVENPSVGLLRLTRYLTGGLVVAGLGLGGLFFWGLTRQAKLSEQTPGWIKYQYLYQKAQAEGDSKLIKHMEQAEQLFESGTLTGSLNHLNKINAARRQQAHFRQEETNHQRQLRQNRP